MRTNNHRNIKFTFLVNEEERHFIEAIAQSLKRSQGDALRFLIGTAALELGLSPKEDCKTPEVKNG